MTQPAAETLTVATSARQVQAALSAQAMREAAQVWPLLDPKRLSDSFPLWLRVMMALTRNYHTQSAQAAAQAYRAMRDLASKAPLNVKLAAPPSEEWMAKAYRFSGPGMLSSDTAQPNTALSTTLGTAARIVQDGARTTTIDTSNADPVAVGWYRVTDGNPCSFCALLASRGIAYKSQRQADFKSHNHCMCSAAPAFSRDHELPELNKEALNVYYQATRGLPNKDRINAFRKAWESRAA